MELYIVRHAWAAERGPEWPDDSLRPLTDDGQRRMAEVVKKLAKRGFAPEVIATSPMVRCQQTAEIVSKRIDGQPRVVPCEHLLPGGDLKSLLAWTEVELGKFRQIAWVGHAPDVDRLTSALIGPGESTIRFSKGAVAALSFDRKPELGSGELRWLATAKILGC